MPSLIQFQAFNKEFRIYTDVPELASLVPRYRFGAETRHIADSLDIWPCRRCLALLKDQAAFRSLVDRMSSPESVPYGPEPGDSLVFDETMDCAAAALPANPGHAERAVYSASPIFVRLALRSANWYFLHAAAVFTQDVGVAFLGENESGKSTLARMLAIEGWDLLSDDSLPVLAAGPDICAAPVREAVNARSAGAGHEDKLRARGFSDSGLDGFLLPPELDSVPVPLRLLVFPEWAASGHAGAIREAAPAFAYKKLLAACNTPLTGGHLAIYAKIIDQLLTGTRQYRLALCAGEPPPVSDLLKLMRRLGIP